MPGAAGAVGTEQQSQQQPPPHFQLPPVLRNARGEVRKAGFELEYSGVSLNVSGVLVRKVFGGEHVIHTTFVHTVRGTRHGEFAVEMDTTLLKEKLYERPMRALGFDPQRHDAKWLESALLGVLGAVVPTEIASPPIPVDELAPLDELCRLLRKHGAKGTRASWLYAFGMHINPEIPSEEPGQLRDYLRAFLLLYPWLKQRGEIDLTRRVSPYINSFPPEYARLILTADYPDSAERLIDDYLQHNPTRNRPLDMVPALAHIDRQRVFDRVQEKHLVKSRPAFHYRLPNCMVDEPHWSLAAEWNRWVAVERLANDPVRLAEMSRDYLAADETSLRPFVDKWPGQVEQMMKDHA